MSSWYSKIKADKSMIPQCIEHFEKQLEDARKELTMRGRSVEQQAARIPGLVEYWYTQYQEVEAILEFMEIEYKRARSKAFKKYTVGYAKALSSRDAEKYVDGDDDVIDVAILKNDVALVRNKYLSAHAALEKKHYQISNITRLRCAGLEDAMLGD